MAKKQRYRQEESQESLVKAESPADSALTAEAAPAPEPSAPEEQSLDLHDAARRWLPGFKEHWWPGIKRHAESMGFSGVGTESQCKMVLRHWGAKL